MVIVRTPFRVSFVGGDTDFVEFFREYGGVQNGQWMNQCVWMGGIKWKRKNG